LLSFSVLLLSIVQSRAELVGYWAFDEGQGTTITDSSGYGNNGTLVGATALTWTQGRHGSALYFDGSSATGVYIPNSPSLQLSNAASFAAWVRCDNPAGSPIFSKEGNPPYYLSYWFGISGGHFGVQLDSNGTQPWDFGDIAQANVIAGQWIHLTATWDGATVSYYTNGVLLPNTDSFSGPLFPGTARLGIGINSEYGDYKFTGVIDEVRIYNHALSQAEVTALAEVKPDTTLAIAQGVAVTWNSVTNMLYQVQWASSLDSNTWFNLGSPVVGNGITNLLFDPLQSSNRFYRVLPLP
jgi:hypothetical protein